jgi:hypothetical protein
MNINENDLIDVKIESKSDAFVRLNLHADDFVIGTKINLLKNYECLVSKFIVESLGKAGFEKFLNLARKNGTIFVEIIGPSKEDICLTRFHLPRLSVEECIEKLDSAIFNLIETKSFWKKMFIAFN